MPCLSLLPVSVSVLSVICSIFRVHFTHTCYMLTSAYVLTPSIYRMASFPFIWLHIVVMWKQQSSSNNMILPHSLQPVMWVFGDCFRFETVCVFIVSHSVFCFCFVHSLWCVTTRMDPSPFTGLLLVVDWNPSSFFKGVILRLSLSQTMWVFDPWSESISVVFFNQFTFISSTPCFILGGISPDTLGCLEWSLGSGEVPPTMRSLHTL